MTLQAFAETVQPLAALLKSFDLEKPAAVRKQLQADYPLTHPLVQKIRSHAQTGLVEGWLLTKEVGGIRFGRAAKNLEGFSVDAVLLSKAGPKHRHPKGEIDLCFAQDGAPRFDGQAEGWVVYAPGSAHVPTVKDGEMLIIYFLPDGAFEILEQ